MENENINENGVLDNQNDKAKERVPGILCALATVLMYVVPAVADVIFCIILHEDSVLLCFLLRIFYVIEFLYCGYDIAGLYSMVVSAVALIGFILMIILRVKYPKYTNGKILMWITIAILVISIAIIWFIAVTCESSCNSCCRAFE